jgi:hypothetical protein
MALMASWDRFDGMGDCSIISRHNFLLQQEMIIIRLGGD